MRARAGFLGGILVLLVGAGVAWLAYQAGLSQAASTAVAAGTAAAPVVVYGGWGFGFFHVFGLIFGLLLLFGIARIFFGILFWRGPRTWGGHGRHGFGPDRPGFGFGEDGIGPLGRRGEFMAEMHRRLHEEEAARGGTTQQAQSTPPASPAQPVQPAPSDDRSA